MASVDVVVLLVIGFLAAIGWRAAVRIHRATDPTHPDCLSLPPKALPVAGALAGSPLLNIRGLLLQLLILTWTPLLVLGNFQALSRPAVATAIGVSSLALLAIDLVFHLARRSRRQ